MANETARARIERFLHDYPGGPLLVAVGYATLAGIAWLNRIASDRPVKLLIGNTQPTQVVEEFFQSRCSASRTFHPPRRHRGAQLVPHLQVPKRGPSKAHLKPGLSVRQQTTHWLWSDRQPQLVRGLTGTSRLWWKPLAVIYTLQSKRLKIAGRKRGTAQNIFSNTCRRDHHHSNHQPTQNRAALPIALLRPPNRNPPKKAPGRFP